MTEYRYRYEETWYAPGVDEDGSIIRGSSSVTIHLYRYRVIKHTRCGVWIDRYPVFSSLPVPPGLKPNRKDHRFINERARKRYAWPSKELAMSSYLARKARHLKILKAQARRVSHLFELIDGNRGVELEDGSIAERRCALF